MTPSTLLEEDKDLAWHLIRTARRSTYTMTAGSQATFFLDADEVYLGRDELFQASDTRAQRARLATKLAADIARHVIEHSISRLAFIEKVDAGPVGMLTWMNLLVQQTGIDACIVRPRKRLLLASVKGRPVQRGERLMIVTDVATTGLTISLAARRILLLGGVVPLAYVLYDRRENALVTLKREGIELVSFLDHTTASRLEAELLQD